MLFGLFLYLLRMTTQKHFVCRHLRLYKDSSESTDSLAKYEFSVSLYVPLGFERRFQSSKFMSAKYHVGFASEICI
jgi:hypothetical protein